VLVYDALVSPDILKLVRAGAELEYAGKRGGKPSAKQRDITERLIELARQGKRVLRLKGGDPFVFGRGGEEALALVDGLAGIRVVVSDVVMPGIGGQELARRLRAEHPDIAVVLATGFSLEPLGEGLEDVPLVAKPWEKKDLIDALTRAMARTERSETRSGG